MPTAPFPYDVFVSHASEDKESVARPLAKLLDQGGFRVWFDEWTLVTGDRLRRKIDEGLRDSRFGIVILSEAFFAKRWPQAELDGLTALETDGFDRILPIWHGVDQDRVRDFSPTLADRLASHASKGVQAVYDEIAAAIRRVPIRPVQAIPQQRAERSRIVNSWLERRALSDPESPAFGVNAELGSIAPAERIRGESTARVVLSVVPLGDPIELSGDALFEWALAMKHEFSHPLAHTDVRPRGDGIFAVYRRHEQDPPTRYTFIHANGYVEWGRALGGFNGQVSVVRLGPLLWAASALYEFALELNDKFGLRSHAELIVSIVGARGTCLSHLGTSWLEPWTRNFDYYRPTSLDNNVQFRWSVSSPGGDDDRLAFLLKLDTYLNRVWGDANPRGHDHPRDHDGRVELSQQYQYYDPWE